LCGIFAVINPRGEPVDLPACRRGTDIQKHRGPDACGEWISSALDVFLGHRRLSIIDLSDDSRQPMTGDSGKILVFNGEIYNFASVRRNLEASGCRFKSSGDTEVLLQAVDTWGTDGLPKLEGMFAFVLWDPSGEEALIVRDFFGIKPLYVLRLKNRGLAVSSEIKSFYALPDFEPRLDTDLLPEHLRFRCVSGERTLLKDVLEVPPGHALRYRRATGDLVSYSYWDPSSVLGDWEARPGTTDEAQRFRDLFTETVRSHLIADVPVGMQFSGGVDSSLVSSIAAKELDIRLTGFHCRVLEPSLDESPFAEEIARILGMDVQTVELSEPMVFSDLLEKLTWHLDEPMMHPNSMGIYLVSKLAYGRVKVLLSGEAADEFFAGYARYPLLLLQDLLRRRPFLLKALGSVGQLLGWAGGRVNTVMNVVRRSAEVDANSQIVTGLSFMDVALIGDLLGRPDVEASSAGRRWSLLGSDDNLDLVTRCRLFDIKTYLPPLFQRQDKMSMAASIENRVPFATPAVFASALGLPTELCAGLFHRKEFLKRYLERYVPRKWVRRQKGGFGIPLSRWFQRPQGRERLSSLTSEESPLLSVMDSNKIAALVSGFDGTLAAADTLWTLLSLKVWMDVFCNRSRCLELADAAHSRGNAPTLAGNEAGNA
jgi:asparagine synthase (glutamine-hydrolysing)